MSARWKKYKRPRNEKVGNMFFTLGLICFIIGILPILSTIAAFAYYVIVGLLIVGTLGIILLNKGFKESLNSGDQVFKDIASLLKYSPYILGVAAIFGLISTIIYAKSTTLRRKGGNVTAGVIFTILPIIIAIFIIRQ
jgi:hypothetical protein